VRTDGSGNVEGTYSSLPFGDGFSASGTDNDPYHYAALDHDSETDTLHAQFRQYSSTQGRWLSPDPYSGSYDGTNPQSFNRYTYALNNPLSLVDPSGLDCTDPSGYVYFDYELGGDGTEAQAICAEMGGTYEPPGVYNVYAGPPMGASSATSQSSYGTIAIPTAPQIPSGSNGGGGSAGSSSASTSPSAPNNPAPKNGWDWDEKPHWPTPPTTPVQPFTDCFNGAMKQSAPPAKNTVTVLTTLTGLLNVISPNPVTKTVNATNALFNMSRITAAGLVCSGGDAYFEP
jgi:RHS repeat-associated protein